MRDLAVDAPQIDSLTDTQGSKEEKTARVRAFLNHLTGQFTPIQEAVGAFIAQNDAKEAIRQYQTEAGRAATLSTPLALAPVSEQLQAISQRLGNLNGVIDQMATRLEGLDGLRPLREAIVALEGQLPAEGAQFGEVRQALNRVKTAWNAVRQKALQHISKEKMASPLAVGSNKSIDAIERYLSGGQGAALTV